MNSPYDDIIKLPHHQSTKHPQMSRHDRAAQFAPFSALRIPTDKLNATDDMDMIEPTSEVATNHP